VHDLIYDFINYCTVSFAMENIKIKSDQIVTKNLKKRKD